MNATTEKLIQASQNNLFSHDALISVDGQSQEDIINVRDEMPAVIYDPSP